LLLQLARAPDQWERIRSEPKLIPRAVEEAVRLATPIRSFTRHVAEDCVLAGVPLPKGARLMLVFASANRDELHFDRPDRFDVERRERDHVGFGQGHHMCVGMHLARLEMTALLRAMAKRVRRIHAGMPQISLNNTIRSYSRLPLAFEAL
jgi:cytochrome P450